MRSHSYHGGRQRGVKDATIFSRRPAFATRFLSVRERRHVTFRRLPAEAVTRFVAIVRVPIFSRRTTVPARAGTKLTTSARPRASALAPPSRANAPAAASCASAPTSTVCAATIAGGFVTAGLVTGVAGGVTGGAEKGGAGSGVLTGVSWTGAGGGGGGAGMLTVVVAVSTCWATSVTVSETV